MFNLKESSECLQKNDRGNLKFKQIPEWNEHCREAHSNAREAFHIWVSHGKPRAGPIFNVMSECAVILSRF